MRAARRSAPAQVSSNSSLAGGESPIQVFFRTNPKMVVLLGTLIGMSTVYMFSATRGTPSSIENGKMIGGDRVLATALAAHGGGKQLLQDSNGVNQNSGGSSLTSIGGEVPEILVEKVKREAMMQIERDLTGIIKKVLAQPMNSGGHQLAAVVNENAERRASEKMESPAAVIPSQLTPVPQATPEPPTPSPTASMSPEEYAAYLRDQADLKKFLLSEDVLNPLRLQEKRIAPDFEEDLSAEYKNLSAFVDPADLKYPYRLGGIHPRDGQKEPEVRGIPWDRKLHPLGWEQKAIELAELTVAGVWGENETQWNSLMAQNAKYALSWQSYSEKREDAAKLQKVRKGEIVTFADVVSGIAASFEAVKRLKKEGRENEIIPVYGYAFTRYDFLVMLHGLARHLDTGIESFVFVQNGANAVGELFIRSLQHIFGSDKVAFYRRQINHGVSNSWNTMATHGFDRMEKEAGFVVISNADCIPGAGKLAIFASATWSGLVMGAQEKDRLMINRLGEFALFAVTSSGWHKLGKFDENLFPAYGEDVEIHIRAVSLGVGNAVQFRNTGPQKEGSDYFHIHATNAKKGITHSRPAMMNYISKKWGVNMGGIRDFQFAKPYRHPWNNCRVFHNDSWILDWGYRDCLRSRTGCQFPVPAHKKLIHDLPTGTPCQEGLIVARKAPPLKEQAPKAAPPATNKRPSPPPGS